MAHNRSKYEPTLEEIEQAKAAIREEWKDRAYDPKIKRPFKPRVYKLARLNGSGRAIG